MAIRASTAWTQLHPDDAEGWRYLASAFGQRSQFAISVIPNNWEVIHYGLKTRDAVNTAFSLDRSNIDVLVGVGAANFFAGNVPWYLRPIAFAFGVHGGNRDLGLRQMTEGMTGQHSRIEGPMVLAAARYSEGSYAEFYKVITEHVTSIYPSLLPAATWAISGCICGGMLNEAKNTAQHEVAGEGWRFLQLGRIALARNSPQDAVRDFSRAIETSGNNRSNLAWAYYGRSLALKLIDQPSSRDLQKARETSSGAFRLAERLFRKPGTCPY
jgi:tetratricopeptide (TPR) repeat protein